jgi:hypothetical protein
LLSDLLRLKNSEKANASIEITNDVLQKELAIDLTQLLSIPEDAFIVELQNKKVTDDNLNCLADILLVLADDATEVDASRRKMMYKKCLLLLEHVQRSDSTYSMERHERIERIKTII